MTTKRKPLVYIASPYTKGDPAINARFQCVIFDGMLDHGWVTPYAPLWSHFQHTLFPRPYEDWVEHDNEMLVHCDALIRLNAKDGLTGYFQSESSGADAEVRLFQEMGKPVFDNITDLYDWVREVWNKE